MFYKLLCDQSASASFWRNAVKALIGFIVAYVPLLLDFWQVPEIAAIGIFGVVVVVLSPLELKLGRYYDRKCAEKLMCKCLEMTEELNCMGGE